MSRERQVDIVPNKKGEGFIGPLALTAGVGFTWARVFTMMSSAGRLATPQSTYLALPQILRSPMMDDGLVACHCVDVSEAKATLEGGSMEGRRELQRIREGGAKQHREVR